jgi:hypothetical protein
MAPSGTSPGGGIPNLKKTMDDLQANIVLVFSKERGIEELVRATCNVVVRLQVIIFMGTD